LIITFFCKGQSSISYLAYLSWRIVYAFIFGSIIFIHTWW